MDPTRSQLNPVAFAFHVIERYRESVRDGLRGGGLSDEDVGAIWSTLTTDRGVLLSRSPVYARHEEPFEDFCNRLGFHPGLSRQFGDLCRLGLYAHQAQAIESLAAGRPTVVATGTGSGKTEAFLVPVVEACLRAGDEEGVRAVLVYPMNALAGDQLGRLRRALDGTGARYGLYTGDTPQEERQAMHAHPPHVLVTNPVMLDRLVTMPERRRMFTERPGTLRYVVLDELHTYGGSRAVHLRALLARLEEVSASRFVPVGTSATLRRAGGVFSDAEEDEGRLRRFLSGTLRVPFEHVTLVEPRVQPEAGPMRPFPQHDPAASYGWDARLDRRDVARLLTALLGEPVHHTELDTPDAPGLLALREAPFVRALATHLSAGSLPFDAAVDLFREGYRGAHGVEPERPEEVVKSYLRLFAYFAETGRPVLDVRFHVFLRDAGGTLRRCLECTRHHAGHLTHCPECGGMLFAVDREHPRACLAKLTLRRHADEPPTYRLVPQLNRQEEDPRAVLYVRLHPASDAPAGALRTHLDPVEEGATLRVAEDAPRALVLEPELEREGVLERTVDLVLSRAEHAYLCTVARTLLDVQPLADPKRPPRLLSFVDSRERAAQLAHVAQDYFADAFFGEVLRRALDGATGPKPLPEAHAAFVEAVRAVAELSDGTPFHERVLRDAPLWFARFVLTRGRELGERPLVTLARPAGLDEVEAWLAQAMLDHRVVLRSFVGAVPEAFEVLRFGGYTAQQQPGVYAPRPTARDERDERSREPRVRSIALTTNTQTFQEGIRRYTIERLLGALDGLVVRGVVRTFDTPDGKRHYALDARLVHLDPGVLRADADLGELSIRALRDRTLVRAETHTADCKADERRRAERDFRSAGEDGAEPLPLLFATPTLEMGVDIGGLSVVLMAGVPPLPSNYAQRAGRAGRREQKSALLVTFCSSTRPHDAFYFAHPELMIDGAVTPPTADLGSPAIVRRHANALVLADLVERGAVQAYLVDPEPVVVRWADRLTQLFSAPDRPFDGAEHLRARLPDELRTWMRENGYANGPWAVGFLNALYGSPLFPDHEFRREEVALRPDRSDPDTVAALRDVPERRVATREDVRKRDDGALSRYVPELALVNLAPNRRVFLPGGRFAVVAPSSTEAFERLDDVSGDGMSDVRDYARGLLARTVRDFGPRERDGTTYETVTWIEGAPPPLLRHGPITVRFAEGATLRFENHGRRLFGGVQRLEDDEGNPFTLAYRLPSRNALVFEVDGTVTERRAYPVNLASALFRALVERFGLAESEVALFFDVLPWEPNEPAEPDERPLWRFAFADVAGNGSVPLRRFGEEVVQLATTAHDRLSACGCERGWYLCLRTAATSREAHLLHKGLARALVGFLAGRDECPTEIAFPAPPRVPDETLTLQSTGNEARVFNGAGEALAVRSLPHPYNGPQFEAIAEASGKVPPANVLRLVLPNRDFAQNFREHRFSKDVPAFRCAVFSLLRFPERQIEVAP